MLLLASLRDYARRTSRAVAFSTAGFIFLMIGIGFFTFALWLMLEQWQDALFAAQVLGALYVAVGLICFAFASAHKSRRARHPAATRPAATPDPLMQVIEGFLVGMAAGRGTSRRRR